MRVTLSHAFRDAAAKKGYCGAALEAAQEVVSRKNGGRVLGSWDNGGRFWAAEKTASVRNARSPSRNWPYSQLKAAQTAAHMAEVYGVDALAVKRLVRALQDLLDGDVPEVEVFKKLKAAPAPAAAAAAA